MGGTASRLYMCKPVVSTAMSASEDTLCIYLFMLHNIINHCSCYCCCYYYSSHGSTSNSCLSTNLSQCNEATSFMISKKWQAKNLLKFLQKFMLAFP